MPIKLWGIYWYRLIPRPEKPNTVFIDTTQLLVRPWNDGHLNFVGFPDKHWMGPSWINLVLLSSIEYFYLCNIRTLLWVGYFQKQIKNLLYEKYFVLVELSVKEHGNRELFRGFLRIRKPRTSSQVEAGFHFYFYIYEFPVNIPLLNFNYKYNHKEVH